MFVLNGGQKLDFQKVKLNNDFKIQIVQYKICIQIHVMVLAYEWSKWLDKLQIPRINSDKYIRGLCVYGDFEDVEKIIKLLVNIVVIKL